MGEQRSEESVFDKKEKRKAAHSKDYRHRHGDQNYFPKQREKALEQLQELYEKAEKAAGPIKCGIFLGASYDTEMSIIRPSGRKDKEREG